MALLPKDAVSAVRETVLCLLTVNLSLQRKMTDGFYTSLPKPSSLFFSF